MTDTFSRAASVLGVRFPRQLLDNTIGDPHATRPACSAGSMVCCGTMTTTASVSGTPADPGGGVRRPFVQAAAGAARPGRRAGRGVRRGGRRGRVGPCRCTTSPPDATRGVALVVGGRGAGPPPGGAGRGRGPFRRASTRPAGRRRAGGGRRDAGGPRRRVRARRPLRPGHRRLPAGPATSRR